MRQTTNDPKIGDKILRKNSNGYWRETEINETYLELIKEFPEDYRKSVKGKRTGADFGAHDFTVDYHGPFTVFNLKIPETQMESIQFIVGLGVTTITGDYGNWVVSREFHPGPNNQPDDTYWLEKLRIDTHQELSRFDAEETRKELNSWLDGTQEYYDPEGPLSKEEIEYLKECLDNCGDRFEYERVAFYDNVGRFVDHDLVPCVLTVLEPLQVIFDGFDVMCGLLEEQEALSKLPDRRLGADFQNSLWRGCYHFNTGI